MSNNSWGQTLISAQIDGTAYGTSNTPTSLLPPAARFTLPANYLAIGSMLRVRASGRISTLAAAPGTLTLDVRLGASTVIFNGGAMPLNVTAQTNASWDLEAILVCRSIGASTVATILGTGKFGSRALIGSAAAAAGPGGVLILPDTAPAVGTGFDSTTSQTVDLFATWSVNNAANTMQLHQYTLESMN